MSIYRAGVRERQNRRELTGAVVVDPGAERNLRLLTHRQNGAARWEQLKQAGWSTAQVRTRVQRGEWHRRFPGVYIIGDPALLPLAEESAALLSFGKRGALGHDSAVGKIWGLAESGGETVDVIVVGSHERPRDGVRIHHVSTLEAIDLRYRHNLRVTAPARTLIDFAIEATSSELEHAISEAVAKRLTNEQQLKAALDRVPRNHPGAARIRARLAEDPELLLHTRSVAERILLPLILEAGLPRPQVNARVHGELVDLHWAKQRLIVEFDSYRFHSSRPAFERDRKRDQKLTANGYRVIRITWWQMRSQTLSVIATIAQALTAQAA